MDIQYDEADTIMLHTSSSDILGDNEFIKVDLTAIDDDDDEDLQVICEAEVPNSNVPVPNLLNKEVFKYFYGSEDQMCRYDPVTYLGVSVVNSRDLSRVTAICPICRLSFYNYSLMRHVVEHFEFEQCLLTHLLVPQSSKADLTVFSSDISMANTGANYTDIRCEICSINFSNQIQLGQHLQNRHCYKDMPYQCPVCTLYRTSFHRCLLTHFTTHHGGSDHLMCMICLKLFTMNQVIWFVKHVERHMTNKQHFCDKCQLRFHTFKALNYHKAIHHIAEGHQINSNVLISQTRRQNITSGNSNQPAVSTSLPKKSLNVAGIEPLKMNKIQVFLPKFQSRYFHLYCIECNDSVMGSNIVTHFNSNNVCKNCGYSTRCFHQYRRHVRQKHVYQEAMKNKYTDITKVKMIDGLDYRKDLCMDFYMICPCSYTSAHPNLMATHVSKCKESGQTCRILPRSQASNKKTCKRKIRDVKDDEDDIKLKFLEILNLVPKK